MINWFLEMVLGLPVRLLSKLLYALATCGASA